MQKEKKKKRKKMENDNGGFKAWNNIILNVCIFLIHKEFAI